MGVENNECVIATTWDDKTMGKVKQWVEELDDDERSLFSFMPSLINGKQTVILVPDGSKKGWAIAVQGEALRNLFVEYLKTFNYEDDSSPFAWVEVGYGEYGQTVLRGNNVNRFNGKTYAA